MKYYFLEETRIHSNHSHAILDTTVLKNTASDCSTNVDQQHGLFFNFFDKMVYIISNINNTSSYQ